MLIIVVGIPDAKRVSLPDGIASGQRTVRYTDAVRILISNIGDGTLGVAELSAAGKLKLVGTIKVGKAPKRVAFLP